MMLTAAAALAGLAIVTQDQAALRAAPRDAGAQQAVLWQGDTLEVRGERLDYLQVYDHRRERAGYIRASQVRLTSLQPPEAPGLLAVLRFVRDTPGAEALGIAYAAAYLKAAPAEAITAEPFDALGTMAERLARRASSRQKAGDTVAAHLDVAAQYGVVFNSYERDATLQLCYDGDAFRQVIAMAAATSAQRSTAALALTRHDCIDPDLRPHEREQHNRWRADVLDRVTAADELQLSELQRHRLRLRRAGVWAQLAFDQARSHAAPQAAAQRALAELAGVNKNELADDDASDLADAAVRVGASRWATEVEPPAAAGARLAIATRPGEPGETCVLLTDAAHGADAPLARRCSHGVVWAASASVSPNGRALALAVQPLAGWRELWVFRRDADGWRIDVLPPASSQPELGYLEFAGWVPGGNKLLLAREAKTDGRFKRSFEVADLATLNTEKQASTPGLLALFGTSQDAAWKRQTVSLR